MKLLTLFLLIGVASASFHEMLDDASEKFLLSFMEGMENAPSLREHFQEFDNHFADDIEIEVKKEIGSGLREVLNKILERVKEGIEQGKVVREEIFDKIKELREQLKHIKEDMGEKGHELLEKIKERAKEFLRNLLDKLKTNKRAVDDQVDEALAELNIRDLLRKLKEHLKKTIDPELLKEKIEKIFGQGSELLDQLLKTLREKGRKKMLILIDRLLEDDDEDESKRSARGISDYWEKTKNYFQDHLLVDLREKFIKFRQWVKDAIEKGREQSKDEIENMKNVMNYVYKSKVTATEAAEYFKDYKEKLEKMSNLLRKEILKVAKSFKEQENSQ